MCNTLEYEKISRDIEKDDNNYSAFSPDLPGCITVGDTIEETTANMREAVELYLETLQETGKALPQGKGLQYHINNNVFTSGEVADEYYITEMEMPLSEFV